MVHTGNNRTSKTDLAKRQDYDQIIHDRLTALETSQLNKNNNDQIDKTANDTDEGK